MRWCDNCQRHAARGYRVGECEGITCTRCPWPGCPCTHGAGCDRGYIDEPPTDPTSNAQVTRCPTCRDWSEALKLLPHDSDRLAS
jgi:hypothetical protein